MSSILGTFLCLEPTSFSKNTPCQTFCILHRKPKAGLK
nr:MAG TPA_asm: hypothetical protein [Caudoviricetes sp.]